jgi:hypothetical protein
MQRVHRSGADFSTRASLQFSLVLSWIAETIASVVGACG